MAISEGIIGRERELAEVATFLTDVRDGPVVLLLAGEPGIGKTTVWLEAVERARASSSVVLLARPAEPEAGLAFAGLADLLEPVVDEVLPLLPEPQRRALAAALLREDAGSGRFDQRAVSAATTTVLRTLAATCPVVVAIDDVQWLDRPSAYVLQFAVRRLADFPVGVLASERVERGRHRRAVLDGTVAEGRLRRVELAPLSLGALHDLLKARLGRAFTRRVLLRIESTTGGNPFFALELARSLPAHASADLVPLSVPSRLLDLVEARIGAVPPSARQVLLVAAAMRSPTVEDVRDAIAGTPEEWRAALEQLESDGIVHVEGRRLRFAHPLFAAAVYASASAPERRRVHRRLASLTEEIEERAHHLALAADTADAELAGILDAAAEHARSRGAPESAAELVEWARTLTPPAQTDDIQRRTVRAAEYRFHAGQLRPARELLEAMVGDPSVGAARADALRLLGEIRYHEDSFPDAIRLFEEALGLVGDDPRVESAIELRLALCFRALGDFRRAEPHTHRAVELAEEIGDDGLLAEALAVLARLDVLLGRGLDEPTLDRALQLEDPHRQAAIQLRPSKVAGDLLVYVGELERAVRILERERERLIERGEESDVPFILSHLTWAECWRGRLAKAAGHADEAVEVAFRVCGPAVQSMALAWAAIVAAHQGDISKTRQCADQALTLAQATGWHTAKVWARWALGVLAISSEDAEAPDAVLGALTDAVEAEGLTEPVRAMFLADEIEALIALGHLDRAERLMKMLDAAGQRLERRWAVLQAARVRALLLAARGDLDGAADAAHQAVAVGGTLELRLEVARTLVVAGQIERRRRRKAPARDLLERALGIFDDAGAGLWARRAERELERAAGRATGLDLTTSERRVAGLVASGLTNREVAARLFMSPKTVEANLARAYRKLGIHSRAQLGARLAAAGAGVAAET